MTLSPFPARDAIAGTWAVTTRWAEWFLNLWTVLKGSTTLVAVPFDAGAFTVDGGTWTVTEDEQIAYWYQRTGNVLTVGFNVANTEWSAGSEARRLAIPGGYRAEGTQYDRWTYIDGTGTRGTGFTRVGEVEGQIELWKDDLSAFVAGGAATARGTIQFRVQA